MPEVPGVAGLGPCFGAGARNIGVRSFDTPFLTSSLLFRSGAKLPLLLLLLPLLLIALLLQLLLLLLHPATTSTTSTTATATTTATTTTTT